jgi:hypothetical protein
MFLGSQFSYQMCFLSVELVHKITNKRGIQDVFVISIHLGTIVTTLHTIRDQSDCLSLKECDNFTKL